MNLAYEWKPLKEVAALIGVTEKALKNFVLGSDGRAVLEHRMVAGKPCVQAASAYEYSRKNCRRQPPGLRSPPGYVPTDAAASTAVPVGADSPAIPADFPTDLKDILARAADPVTRSMFSANELRAFASVVSVLERIKVAEEKVKNNLSPDEAIEMLQGLRDVYVHFIEGSAGALAAEVIKLVNELANIDLLAASCVARGHIENAIREHGNRTLQSITSYVDDQVKGVRTLDGTV